MNDEHASSKNAPGRPQAEAPIQEGLLAAVPANRREFVKRLLVAAGAGIAVITSLSISEVMAHGRLKSGGT